MRGETYGGGGGVDGAGDGETDVFWFWPGTFIKDAEKNDVLQMFGAPLIGGSNAFAVETSNGGLAQDSLSWGVFYGATGADQLLVYSRLFSDLGVGATEGGFRPDVMVVENFDFGGFEEAANDNDLAPQRAHFHSGDRNRLLADERIAA